MAHTAGIVSPQQVLVALPGYHVAGNGDVQPSLSGSQLLRWPARKVSGSAGTSLHRGLKIHWDLVWARLQPRQRNFSLGVKNPHTSVQQPPFTHGTPPHFNATLTSAHAHILSKFLATSSSQPKASDPKGVGCFPSSEESSTPTGSGLEKQPWKEKMDQIKRATGGAVFACRL